MQHKMQVDKLAYLCKAEKYFAVLKKEGNLDFIDISMNLSSEAEIEFVGDTQSPGVTEPPKTGPPKKLV